MPSNPRQGKARKGEERRREGERICMWGEEGSGQNAETLESWATELDPCRGHGSTSRSRSEKVPGLSHREL